MRAMNAARNEIDKSTQHSTWPDLPDGRRLLRRMRQERGRGFVGGSEQKGQPREISLDKSNRCGAEREIPRTSKRNHGCQARTTGRRKIEKDGALVNASALRNFGQQVRV